MKGIQDNNNFLVVENKVDIQLTSSGWSPSAFSEQDFSVEKKNAVNKAVTGNAFGSLRMKDWSRNQNERFKKIDEFGRVGIVETLTRSELCELYGLKFSDLRDFDSRANVPLIINSGTVIILNILNLRALITIDSILIFGENLTAENNTTFFDRSQLIYQLSSINDQFQSSHEKENLIPYEFRALACCLDTVCCGLENEYAHMNAEVLTLIDTLNAKIQAEGQKNLLLLSHQIDHLLAKIQKIINCFKWILEKESILHSLHLSNPVDHQNYTSTELEILLESCFRFLEDLKEKAELTIYHIKITGELIDLNHNHIHNTLTAMETRVGIFTCGVGGAALVGGMFGMNLTHGYEEAPFGFIIVVTISIFVATSGIVWGMMVLDKVIKGSRINLPRFPNGTATVVPIGSDS
ncbi:uncharacterized protein MELLADRAFT_106166 [Melampsora larici-populina 98AG31]|uniref:Magnesium transporter n=1 Tax=Melampsora larici-populina (strain 98AG31 / pathotype 3-4-7) TaxID=747676 RepID=F4RKL6_MELLP|nr:uncharacterized protein MELLADRAFT_106166 [Melampsora larici-populina 98AG31]EGG07156.1 hypothetical protein MELLADRAFT_106166 [Melampsora larici-populina 98AG31]